MLTRLAVIFRVRSLYVLIVCCLTWPAAAQDASVEKASPILDTNGLPLEEIQPADVWVHVDHVRQELEQLRAYMGRPKDSRSELDISGAEPREVFFQAVTLFRKADRLCFEQTREQAGEEPMPPDGKILPGHVYQAVDRALQRILVVKSKLGLTTELAISARDDDRTPSDVLRSIIQANRQLNLLLERQFAPSDVFGQVTLAVGYSERLLDRFPGAVSMPDAPPFAPNKRPAHVYGRLLDSYERIRQIILASGLKVLELKRPDEELIQNVAPSDVYDIASLLVSELAFVHGRIADAEPLRKVYFSGRKFPSDVFQRAGILEAQLVDLERRVALNPDWIRNPPAASPVK